jgi:hypothetical protein
MSSSSSEEIQPQKTNPNNISLGPLIDMAKEKGFEIEQDKDYGAGAIDLVWNISSHPALPKIKCGFIVLRAGEEAGGSKDWDDNQFSLRKIEEAAMRGMRSGMDKTYLVVENEDRARSVSGKIEWLASFGSIIRLDSISLGLAPDQKQPAIISPSQKRVPEGEKLRKEEMRQREEKFDEFNRPKGERKQKESKEQEITREVMLDEHSRPKDQKKKEE